MIGILCSILLFCSTIFCHLRISSKYFFFFALFVMRNSFCTSKKSSPFVILLTKFSDKIFLRKQRQKHFKEKMKGDVIWERHWARKNRIKYYGILLKWEENDWKTFFVDFEDNENALKKTIRKTIRKNSGKNVCYWILKLCQLFSSNNSIFTISIEY